MRQVTAHNREWCSVAVLLTGREDAQAYFLRWLKKSRFAHLEVTGAALMVLKKAAVIKPRAPIGTLVLVADLPKIAQAYNARKPKRAVEDVLDAIVWKEAVVLDTPPEILGSEPEAKKTKLEAEVDLEKFDVPMDDLLPFSWEDEPPHALPFFALAHLPTWIVIPGSHIAAEDPILSGFMIQQVVRSPAAISILLPPMPPGQEVLIMSNEQYPIRVISEETTKLICGELKQ